MSSFSSAPILALYTAVSASRSRRGAPRGNPDDDKMTAESWAIIAVFVVPMGIVILCGLWAIFAMSFGKPIRTDHLTIGTATTMEQHRYKGAFYWWVEDEDGFGYHIYDPGTPTIGARITRTEVIYPFRYEMQTWVGDLDASGGTGIWPIHRRKGQLWGE